MPYEKNENDYSGPKKADIIIRNTQHIAAKQEDLSEQTKLAVSRIDEAIELFSKNNQDSSYIVKQSGELFTQIQSENADLKHDLKQDLLYIAKQSENIYANLADKINELSEQAKTREDAMNGFADRINDIAEQTRKGEETYSLIVDKLAELSEQNKRSERMYVELTERLAAVKTGGEVPVSPIVTERVVPAEVDLSAVLDKLNMVSDQLRRNERAYNDLYDKVNERVNDRPAERTIIREKADAADMQDFREILDKLARLSEQLRRSDNAHSMLADKFEILSMRVEQYAFENTKNPAPYQSQPQVAPVVLSAPSPSQTVNAEIDYDKLAEKVASLISTEAVSPDYIASKVAEQIIIPDGAPNVNVTVDADYIANKVVDRLGAHEAPAAINIDGEEIADKVAQRLNKLNAEEIAASSVSFDEDGFADMLVSRLSEIKPDEEVIAQRIAEKLDVVKPEEHATAPQTLDLDEEELASRLAEKLGGIKSEENVSEPVQVQAAIDEEKLAERIASKIGGYNIGAMPVSANVDLDEEELADAISLKVGSLKAEDFEILVDDDGCTSISKEIANNLDYNTISNILADKLREALDIAAAVAPDYEEMAERISEKITVAGINEDAIAEKAAAVLSNYMPEFDTEEITDKITGAVIDVVSAMPQPTVDSEEICNAISEKLIESQEEHDYDIVVDDDGISRITGLVSEEIENKTGVRFDKVEDDIAKLCEAVAKISEYVDSIEADAQDEVDEEYLEEVEDDYSALSEVVATEIEKGVAARLDTIEDNIAKITELITSEEEVVGEVEEEYGEDDYAKLSEVVAAEIEKGVSVQLSSVADNIAKITEYLAEAENEEEAETELAEAEPSEEAIDEEDEDYAILSEVVASEVERRVAYRLDTLEEGIAKLTEIITAEEEVEEEEEITSEDETYEEEAVEVDYSALSEVVAAEIEKGVAARLDTIEEKISSIADIINSEEEVVEEEADGETEEEVEYEEDYSSLSEAVADEVEKRVSTRLEALEENVSKIAEIITAEPEEEYEEADVSEEAIEEEVDYTELSEAVANEVEKRVAERLENVEASISNANTRLENVEDSIANTNYRFDSVDDNLAKISELVQGGVKTDLAAEAVSSTVPVVVAAEIEKGVKERLDSIDENLAKITELVAAEEEVGEYEEYEVLDEEDDYAGRISAAVTTELEKCIGERFDALEENVNKIAEIITAEPDEDFETEEEAVEEEVDYTELSEAVANEVERRVADKLAALEDNLNKLTEIITLEPEEVEEGLIEEEDADYTEFSEAVANEVERRVAEKLTALEESVNKITEIIGAEPAVVEKELVGEVNVDYDQLSEVVANEVEKRVQGRLAALEESVNKITDIITAETRAVTREYAGELSEKDYNALSYTVASAVENRVAGRLSALEDNVNKLNRKMSDDEEAEKEEAKAEKDDADYTDLSDAVASEVEKRVSNRFDSVEDHISKITDYVGNSNSDDNDNSLNDVKDEVREIKELLVNVAAATEAAAAQAAEAEEEQELVTVSDLVEAPESEEDEEDDEEEDADDFLIGVLDMDAFSDDELMPGELSEYSDGVDFANMMKFKRSFIARIIQSSDDNKQYYGEVKHALLSYRKVNSNVAWGAERFNKGRETIARMKIRGKTLCLYLALDPKNYKDSVYHHVDVSDNKSVAGTPMMVKVKSPLGVRKAIRLIDEMLSFRNGEKREIPERDYAAMYPYETIEELIDDGLVKDVRKDK